MELRRNLGVIVLGVIVLGAVGAKGGPDRRLFRRQSWIAGMPASKGGTAGKKSARNPAVRLQCGAGRRPGRNAGRGNPDGSCPANAMEAVEDSGSKAPITAFADRRADRPGGTSPRPSAATPLPSGGAARTVGAHAAIPDRGHALPPWARH